MARAWAEWLTLYALYGAFAGVIIEDVTEQEEKEAEASRTVAAEQATRAESTVPAPPATSGAPALGPEAIR